MALAVLLLSVPLSSVAAKTQQPHLKVFKPFSMAFVPDIHLTSEKQDDWALYNESQVIFQELVRTLNNTPNLAFTVFGGDMIENQDKKLDELSLFTDLLFDFKTPFYVIPGDREADLVEDYDKRDFIIEFLRNGFNSRTQPYWVQEPEENLVLIGLDTTVTNKFEGTIPQEELDWLKSTLEANKDKFTIIAMHHPAVTPAYIGKDKFQLSNSTDFLSLIKDNPQVKLVLSGHQHLNYAKKINSTVFLDIPSVLTYPNEYAELNISADKVRVNRKKIAFKQLIKKSKSALPTTEYAKNMMLKNKKELFRLQKGDDFSNQKVYFFEDETK